MNFEAMTTEEIQTFVGKLQTEKEKIRNQIRSVQSFLDSRIAVDGAREKLKTLSPQEIAALRSVVVAPEPVSGNGVGQNLAG